MTVTETALPRRGGPNIVAGARIGLFGEFGIGNIGNDASLQAVAAALARRYPNAVLTCICRGPELIQEQLGLQAVGVRSLSRDSWALRRLPASVGKIVAKVADIPHLIKVVADQDVIVVPGTGILEQFGVRASAIPSTLFLLGMAGRLTRTPIAWISVGAEPSGRGASRWLMRSVLSRARYRSYRDELSRASVGGLGVDTDSDPIYPDVVFGLLVEQVAPSISTIAVQPGLVGVGIMGYYGSGQHDAGRTAANVQYQAHMTKFVQALLDDGHPVQLITTDFADEETARQLANVVLAARPGASLGYRPSIDLAGLLTELAPCELVVATRFHNLIAAILLAKPCVSLEYAPKNAELMASVGCAHLSQQIDGLDVARLLEQCRRAEAEQAAITEALRSKLHAYQSQLEQQQDQLASQLLAGLTERPEHPGRSGQRSS